MNKKFLFITIPVFVLALWISRQPSNALDWTTDQSVLADVTFTSDTVQIKNIRNYRYRSNDDYDPAYYDAEFDPTDILSVDYIVVPFAGFPGTAHTFLTFGFKGNRYVSVSVEIRKEKGESFSAWKGLFKQYELMYVIADERDVIGLRTNIRRNDVYLYPVKLPKQKIAELFLSMMHRTEELETKPEFYNSITNSCATNAVSHINEVTPGRMSFSYKIVLPGFSDDLFYDHGLIDTDLARDQIRAGYKISSEQALKYADAPDFSVRIRQHP